MLSKLAPLLSMLPAVLTYLALMLSVDGGAAQLVCRRRSI